MPKKEKRPLENAHACNWRINPLWAAKPEEAREKRMEKKKKKAETVSRIRKHKKFFSNILLSLFTARWH